MVFFSMVTGQERIPSFPGEVGIIVIGRIDFINFFIVEVD